MKRVSILGLRLENFRGLRRFDLEPHGEDADVHGDNATGKTTLADAWFWLTTGSDSHGDASFEIKTLDEQGDPVHNLDHSVEAVLDVGGRTVTLRKAYKEVWEKKRGNPEASFSGHTTDHFVDGVPVQASEYARRLAEIASPTDFRVLGDPAALLDRMPWKERRAAVLEMAGDATDEEVLATVDLPALASFLDTGRPLDDVRKVAQASRKEANERLKTIPARIDEANRTAGNEAEPPTADEVEAAESAVREAEARLAEAKATTAAADHAAKVRELGAALAEAKAALTLATAEAKRPIEDAARAARMAHSDSIEECRARVAMVGEAKRAAQQVETKLQALRDDHARIKGEEFKGREGECPTCGQVVPQEKVQAARGAFNASKSDRLALNIEAGKAARAEFEEAKSALAHAENLHADALAKAEEADKARESAANALSKFEIAGDHDAVNAVAAAAAALEEARSAEPAAPDTTAQEQEAIEARAALQGVYARRAAHEAAQAAKARIVQLEAEEREALEASEAAERLLFECDEFVRAKVRLVEGRAAAATPGVEWKLFRELVNGGIEECCEATVGGVPYPALNNAAQIQAGLACIDALAHAKGLALPVIVDGAESVIHVPPTVGQQARLRVDASAKTLEAFTAVTKELQHA